MVKCEEFENLIEILEKKEFVKLLNYYRKIEKNILWYERNFVKLWTILLFHIIFGKKLIFIKM